jgi:hypothetical protein
MLSLAEAHCPFNTAGEDLVCTACSSGGAAQDTPHHVLAVLSACCVFMTEPCHALTLQEKAWFAQRAAVAAQRKAQRNAAAGQGGKITRESSYCSSWQHFERVCSAIAVLLFAVSG